DCGPYEVGSPQRFAKTICIGDAVRIVVADHTYACGGVRCSVPTLRRGLRPDTQACASDPAPHVDTVPAQGRHALHAMRSAAEESIPTIHTRRCAAVPNVGTCEGSRRRKTGQNAPESCDVPVRW